MLMASSPFAKMYVICSYSQQLAPMITNPLKSVKLMSLMKVMTYAIWLISTIILITSMMDPNIQMQKLKLSMKFSPNVMTVLSPSASMSAMR